MGKRTEESLAAMAEAAQRELAKQTLLSLLQEHLTIRVSHAYPHENKVLKVEIDFDEVPIASDWIHSPV